MSEALDTPDKLDACAFALINWFRSQDLEPADAMLCLQWFQARMVIENSHTTEDIVRKVELSQNTILKFIMVMKIAGRHD